MSSLISERTRRKRGRISREEKRPRPYRNRRTRLENEIFETEKVSIVKSEPVTVDEEIVEIKNEDFDGEIDVEELQPKIEDDEIQHVEEEMFSDEDGVFENKKSFLTPENRRKKKVESWRDIEDEIESENEEYSELTELMLRMGNVELDPLALPTVYEEDLIKSDFDCDFVLDSPMMSPKETIDSDHEDYSCSTPSSMTTESVKLPLISPRFENRTEQKRNASELFDDLMGEDIEKIKKVPREKKMYRKRITDPKLLIWFSKNVTASQKYADCTKLIKAEKEREIRDLQIIAMHSAEKERDPATKLAEELWNNTDRLPTFDEMFEED